MKIILHDKNTFVDARIEFEGEYSDVKYEMEQVYGEQAKAIFERLEIFQPAQSQRQEITGCDGGRLLHPSIHQMEVSE